MVARSTTREAGNLARETQLTENGYDLVEMTTHYPTCKICAPLQGRVYSISGKDKRFPPLSKAFKDGYHNVHPNCRHSVHPWIEELQDPDEIQKALDDSGKPFEDNRPEEEQKLYNKQQAQNRRARDDRRQYERYKGRLGEDAPKTFSAFRRMKKAAGDAWTGLQSKYKNWLYAQEYSDIIHLKGKLPNYQVRRWYKSHVEKIPEIVDKTTPLENQARQSFSLRNEYKSQARALMLDRDAANLLDSQEPIRSFEELVESKMKRKSLSRDEALADILKTSTKTRKTINEALNLE